jgi:hypothetical protein
MNKKIIMISNPGESHAENYCEGVNVDIKAYTDFFTSPLGGAWERSEMQHLDRPTAKNVRDSIADLKEFDYSLILFCGHGWYSSVDRSTILELRSGESLNELDLREGGRKRLILLDCCREVHHESIVEASMENFSVVRKAGGLSRVECRKYYEDAITKASSGIVVTHACDLNETAGDSEIDGGYYSFSLRSSARNWMTSTSIDLSKKYLISSIVKTHTAAVGLVGVRSGGRQNPKIEKPRSEPYFPFAVLA